MEVCKFFRFFFNGVRFKWILGIFIGFKNIVLKIVNEFKL